MTVGRWLGVAWVGKGMRPAGRRTSMPSPRTETNASKADASLPMFFAVTGRQKAVRSHMHLHVLGSLVHVHVHVHMACVHAPGTWLTQSVRRHHGVNVTRGRTTCPEIEASAETEGKTPALPSSRDERPSN